MEFFLRKTKVNKKGVALIFYLLSFLMLFTQASRILDPDFGWRLKTGQIILKLGLPHQDPFSYTMPSFPFVDHAWLTDVFLALLYPLIGKIGLALLFSFLVFLTFYLVSARKPLVILFSSSFVFGFMATARPQFFGWLIFALLMKCFLDAKFWQKYKKFIPLVFVLWANLHGSFPAGLTVLLIRALFSFLFRRKLSDFYIFVTSFLATFLNPYGLGIWREILRTLLDNSLRWRIAEWQPFFLSLGSFLLLGFIALTGVLTTRYLKKICLEELAIVSFFFLQMMVSVRHLPFWLIVTLPYTLRLFKLFKKEILATGSLLVRKRYSQAKRWVITGSLGLILVEVALVRLPAASIVYPEKAVVFLRQNLPEGQIFSVYNWGGYLIWQIPEKKVFIDGRMPSWETKKEIPGESKNAFADYQKLLGGKIDTQAEFEKYGIKTVLFPSSCSVDVSFWFLKKLGDRFKLNVVTMPEECRFPAKIQETGWQKVYEDKVAIIYQKT